MRPLPDRKEWLRDVPFWIAAVLAGLASVGFALLCKNTEDFALRLLDRHPFEFFALSPIAFVAAWWTVWRFAPEAKGSGIPQVMAAVELQAKDSPTGLTKELLSLRTMATKILSAFLCLLGGGAIGREGPTVQIAASIFTAIGNRTAKWNRVIRPEVWMVTGSAAGIAATFNTPLGGLVFAIEELTSTHFASFRTSLITAVIISGVSAQWILGTYLYLGYPNIPAIGAKTLLWAVGIGMITGTGGSLFGRILYRVTQIRKKIRSVRRLALVAFGAGLLVVLLGFFFDRRGLGGGRDVVIHLLFKKAPLPLVEGVKPGWTNADFRLAISRFVTPIIAYASGAAGGIFAPSLGAGGALGSLIADLFRPGLENLFVILGMIGFLTGVTHAPFTAFVLVLEMTDRHTAIMPMMVTALIASVVAKWWHAHSFYERVKHDYIKASTPAPVPPARTKPRVSPPT